MNAKGQYQMRPLPTNAKRCDHGFLGGENCQECHPELRCCTYCWMPGHDEPACRFSPKGKRLRQAEKERKRYGLRKLRRKTGDPVWSARDLSTSRGDP